VAAGLDGGGGSVRGHGLSIMSEVPDVKCQARNEHGFNKNGASLSATSQKPFQAWH
jgi:hypothetical protein